MSSSLVTSPPEASPSRSIAAGATQLEAALLTGGFDRPYVFGLAPALVAKNVNLDVIGSDDVDGPEMHSSSSLNFLNLRGGKGTTGLVSKISRVLIYYARLVRYAAVAKPRIFHILWNNKFEVVDRTLLMVYYKLLRKKVVLTAHNVNAGKRDGNDTLLNRLTLKIQYRLADGIFVHTELMKQQLVQDFGVGATSVTVIPFGVNSSVPDTDLTPSEAKQRLSIHQEAKTILFFGAIRPYKGLDCLVSAFQLIAGHDPAYRLIIAGESRKDTEEYLSNILDRIAQHPSRAQVISKIEYVPDADTELYFKAADVLVLPYAHIFQSGVLFLAYNFGLPVVATDVGSFRENIVEGHTGFLCSPGDATGLAETIERYFESGLYNDLARHRTVIKDYANTRHSWSLVGDKIVQVYTDLGTAEART